MSKSATIDAYKFLKKNYVAVVATSFLALPFASSVCYVIDRQFNFYFLTKMNTSKFVNIMTNKGVAMVIGTGPKNISVQVRGNAVILKNNNIKRRVISEIRSKLNKAGTDVWPIEKIKHLGSKTKLLDEKVIFKVTPEHLAFFNLDDKAFPKSISNKYHLIIPKSP